VGCAHCVGECVRADVEGITCVSEVVQETEGHDCRSED
jgi:hypothetical protein